MVPVFCKKCKYLVEEVKECHHPRNIGMTHNWYEKTKHPLQHPKKINSNNDCSWYKEIWYEN